MDLVIKNMDRKKNLKILQTILIIFLIIQPIFDLKIFYNSISTLIRVVVIGILFIICFILDNNKKKYWFLLYFGILIIYFILHHINALNFKSLVPGNFNYNIIEEFLYMIKMVSPFLLIYLLYRIKLPYSKIKLIIKFIVCIISGIIIFSNIFMISYGSYSDELIKGNFFIWFTTGYSDFSYYELASKGLFEFANQIGAVLVMFLPFILYFSIKDKKITDFVALLINVFGLIFIGTKTSVLGIFIVYILVFILFFIYIKLLKKEKINLKSFIFPMIVLVIYLLILPFNPIFNRSKVTNYIIETGNIIKLSSKNTDLKLNFIEKNYENKRIHKQFILNSYPYQYDPDFWIEIMNEPVSKRIDYRYLETKMIKRVIEINDNKFDKIFGITNTRLQNIFNIERDFVVQYYAMGILGLILLLGPYVVLLIIFINKFIKKYKNFLIINFLSWFVILFLIIISIYSGNLFNSLSFTIYFTVLFYTMYSNFQISASKKE